MIDSSTLTYFPIQSIPFSEKDENWKKACIDGVINICYAYGRTRRSPMQRKLRNYNLFNNIIDKADFDYVLNPFNLSKEKLKSFSFPASLQPYDVVSKYFNLLIGEEYKRIFTPAVRAINESALNQKQKQKKEEILEGLTQALMTSLQNPEDPFIEETISKYSNYTPKMMVESVSEKLLQHFMRKENLPKIFNDCFKDYLIAGEEIVRVDKVAKGPRVTRVNPMETWYQLPTNSDMLDEAEKIYERNQMTVSEIVDEFYEYLSEDQLEKLQQYGSSTNSLYNFGDQSFLIPTVDSIYAFEANWSERGIPVHRVRWKSKKKMGIWTFINDYGEPQQVLVEEGFKINKKDKTQSIEWFWINEYWEGIRIGTDMYLYDLIRPRKQQFRSIDNLSECKSGYVGNVCSATNSVSTSLMDRLVPWVYLYMIIWYRTELAMAANIGKIALIDLSLVPDGWEVEKWLYYATAMKIGFVNSFNESNRKFNGTGQNMSTQNKELNLETGNYIQQHIGMLEYISQQIEATSGITRQRLGAISTSELVGNTERAVTQSSHITEPYFAPHDFFKIRVCEALIEVAKECLKDDNRSFQYVTDDLATILFEVNGAELSNIDMGVFTTNAIKDKEALENLKALLQSAVQSEQINMSTVAKVLNSTSFADIEATLIKAEQISAQNQQIMAEKEQAVENQRLQIEMEKLEREDSNAQKDRETKIQVAEIQALGYAKDTDVNDNNVPDVIDVAKMALEGRKQNFQENLEKEKLSLEKEKMNNEMKKVDKEAKLKEKEMQIKQNIEKLKARTAVRKSKNNKK
jgi:hypothetical protein